MTTGGERMREAFEAWVFDEPEKIKALRNGNTYNCDETGIQWEAWQAAWRAHAYEVSMQKSREKLAAQIDKDIYALAVAQRDKE